MKNEQIVECGRVLSLNDNIADVSIARSEHCEACDSLFCIPKSNSERIITVSNKIKAKVGDVLLKLSVFVYGLPINTYSWFYSFRFIPFRREYERVIFSSNSRCNKHHILHYIETYGASQEKQTEFTCYNKDNILKTISFC